ncbi:hypothetical protein Goarm_022140, partial [Gossypium armourianum]|nr:hypothetical protein [Gossypium armourianum]
YGHVQAECANLKKKSLNVTWSYEDSSSSSNLYGKRLSNYTTFTTKVISSNVTDLDTNNESNGESNTKFLQTYQTMLEKWNEVCHVNKKLIDENFNLKEEKQKLFKKIELKDSLLVEKIASLENTQKDLAATQSMIEKFNSSSGILDELLIAGKRDLEKGGIEYVDKKGKAVVESPIVFVKAINNADKGESSK